MKFLLRTILLCLVLAGGSGLAAHSQRVVYGSRGKDTTHRVPCPSGIVPGSITITQKGVNAELTGPFLPYSHMGSSNRSAVRQLYSTVCAMQLVGYSVPEVNCPKALSSFSWHLVFYRGRTKVLGVLVSFLGCDVLSIDGHRKLGTAWPQGKFFRRLQRVIDSGNELGGSDITITAPPASSQLVKIALGRYLQLIIPAINALSNPDPSWLVHTDPKFLKLIASGPDWSKYYYRWRAASTGQTEIVLDPPCLPRGCRAPSLAIRVLITG